MIRNIEEKRLLFYELFFQRDSLKIGANKKSTKGEKSSITTFFVALVTPAILTANNEIFVKKFGNLAYKLNTVCFTIDHGKSDKLGSGPNWKK